MNFLDKNEEFLYNKNSCSVYRRLWKMRASCCIRNDERRACGFLYVDS